MHLTGFDSSLDVDEVLEELYSYSTVDELQNLLNENAERWEEGLDENKFEITHILNDVDNFDPEKLKFI